MREESQAESQYGDFRGTIAVDGFDGPFLDELELRIKSSFPGGYLPVGLEIYAERERFPDTTPDPDYVHVSVLAVDASILEETNFMGVQRYAKKYGEVPVFRFSTNLTIEDIMPHIKRLSLAIHDRCTEGVPVMVSDPRDGTD